MTCKGRKGHPPRRAFMLIEFMIALAFLALTTGVTLKMHQARLDFDRALTQQLIDQLRIENVAEQLSVAPSDDLVASAEEFAEQPGLKIDVIAIDSDNFTGSHVTITIESESGPLRHHFWHLESQP